MKKIFFFCWMLSGIVYSFAQPVYTHIYSPGCGYIAIRVTPPAFPRYTDGAPVIVIISESFTPGAGNSFNDGLMSTLVSEGFIHVSYLWPGKTDLSSGQSSQGFFDYGGPVGMSALMDVLLFAQGTKTDSAGKFIGQVCGIPALSDNVGLYAFSHPGIAATNIMAFYGDTLDNIKYIVGRENPTADELSTLVPGHWNGSVPDINPFYSYATDYTPTKLNIDYTTVGWLVDTANPNGVPYFGIDTSFIMGTQVLSMFGLKYYNVDLLNALIVNGALDTSAWPVGFATNDSAIVHWAYRETVNNYPAVGIKSPDLKVMLIFCKKDHVQSATDKPHIHQAYDGFRTGAGLWVRMNPDSSYIRYVNNGFTNGFPDNDANTQPSNWMQIVNWAYKDTVNVSNDVPAAGVIEMADRVHENEWSANLNGIINLSAGIQATENISDYFRIYPNPADDFLTFDSNIPGLNSINIYDVLGKQIAEFYSSCEKIDISGFNNGLYFLKIQNNMNTAVFRFIKK